jgi:NAD(P)-dependent dehydrogenase (short-subunit alcohol dehydrogenase family)
MAITFGGIEGRQFVITGGAGGIGRACARQLLDGGARVLLVDVDAARLDDAVASLGGGALLDVHRSALASPAEAASCLDAAGRPVYGLIHMAGLFEPDPLDPDDHGVYDRAMASSLHNGYDLAVAYQSRRDTSAVGRLVLCSSGAFRRGAPGHVAYSAAKAGPAHPGQRGGPQCHPYADDGGGLPGARRHHPLTHSARPLRRAR